MSVCNRIYFLWAGAVLLASGLCGCSVSGSGGKPEYKAAYSFTQVPVLLEGYTGTAGPGGGDIRYYLFGDYPQTVRQENVAVSSVPAGNGYYAGSDGNYYAKVEERGDSMTVAGGVTYSDGSAVKEKSEPARILYFKVEPVVWRLVTDRFDHDAKESTAPQALFLCEKILTAGIPFSPVAGNRKIDGVTILPNNYKYSEVRAFLNGSFEKKDSFCRGYAEGGFLQQAFTRSARKRILLTTVDNSIAQMSFDGRNGKVPLYDCENTRDRVFLMSELEMVSAGGLGFPVYEASIDDAQTAAYASLRVRMATDYAKANGADQSCREGQGGWWWLRSPNSSHSLCARDVRGDGCNVDYGMVIVQSGGIVPAITVSLR